MKSICRAIFMATFLLAVACSSPKETFVSSLSEFSEQVKSEYQTYSSNDLQIVSEQYLAFRKEAELYAAEFTEQDKLIVDECYRTLNEIIARSYVESGISRVMGYFEEAVNLIEDLSGTSAKEFINKLDNAE